jgi:hypothetical protein
LKTKLQKLQKLQKRMLEDPSLRITFVLKVHFSENCQRPKQITVNSVTLI